MRISFSSLYKEKFDHSEGFRIIELPGHTEYRCVDFRWEDGYRTCDTEETYIHGGYSLIDGTGRSIGGYSDFRDFSEGLAAVCDGRWGFIDKNGQEMNQLETSTKGLLLFARTGNGDL